MIRHNMSIRYRCLNEMMKMRGEEMESNNTPTLSKFEQLVHYIIWYCKKQPKENLGMVKLNKILWLLDAWQYCHTKKSMSGEKYYIKRQYGPVPPHILAACETLDTAGILQIKGYTESGKIDIKTAKITASPNPEAFNDDELRKIKEFCDELKEINSHKLSEYSHNDVWDAYEEGDRIPLAAYLVAKPVKPSAEDIEWAKQHAL